MEITPLALRGAFLLEGTTHPDSRGEFSRIVDLDALRQVVDDGALCYLASAHNHRRGTLRGLHYQVRPHEEAKTVWCQTGSAVDVLVDLRLDEPTFATWTSVDLSAERPRAVHVPRGVAHGYQTTSDDTTMMYLISSPHQPTSARTISWRDPDLSIDWPLPVTAISDADAQAPGLKAALR